MSFKSPKNINIIDRAARLLGIISPSGDMARKDAFDRNPIPKPFSVYESLVANTPIKTQWTYTVPSGKKAIHCIIFGLVNETESVYTSGAAWEVSTDGGTTWYRYADLIHWSTTMLYEYFTTTVTFYLTAGNMVRGRAYNDDNKAHGIKVGALFLEFDA